MKWEPKKKKLKAKQKTKEKIKKNKKIVVEQNQIQQTCFYCLFRLRPYLHTYPDIFQSGDFSSQFSKNSTRPHLEMRSKNSQGMNCTMTVWDHRQKR